MSALQFVTKSQAVLLATFLSSRLLPMLAGLGLMASSALAFIWLARLSLSDSSTRAIVGAKILYVASTFSTSFIEEEHAFWYWISCTTWIFLAWSMSYVLGRVAASSLPVRPSSPFSDRRRGNTSQSFVAILLAASTRIAQSWSFNGKIRMVVRPGRRTGLKRECTIGQKNVPDSSISAYISQHTPPHIFKTYSTAWLVGALTVLVLVLALVRPRPSVGSGALVGAAGCVTLGVHLAFQLADSVATQSDRSSSISDQLLYFPLNELRGARRFYATCAVIWTSSYVARYNSTAFCPRRIYGASAASSSPFASDIAY
jgi:hypothetical protein